MGKIGTALKAIKSAARGVDPLLMGAGVAATGLFVGQEVIKPIGQAVGNFRTQAKKDVNMAGLLLQQRRQRQFDQVRAEKLQALIADNSARLATAHPDIYNSVLVGRKLPRGAVVIGSPPGGLDRIQELAAAMSQGSFKPQPSAEDQYLQQLLQR